MYRPVTPCIMSELNLKASPFAVNLALVKAQAALGQVLRYLGNDLAVLDISSRVTDLSIELVAISLDFSKLVDESSHV